MHTPISKLLTACLLAARYSMAQGPPGMPPWANNGGHPQVDPLAGSPWSPQPGAVGIPGYRPGAGGPPGGWQAAPLGMPPGGAPPGMPGAPPNGAPPGMSGPPPGAAYGIASAGPEPSSVKAGGESELQLEQGFPGRPTKCAMYTYVPKTYKNGNPLVVALHHCGGTGTGYFRENADWAAAADRKGFMMIFASSPGGTGGCWDVSSQSSLKHDGGGDSQTIANMVSYAQKKYGAGKQVYVVGHSSGAMLTQVMGATYPDVFLAGAAYSGVPAGCFRTDKPQGADWNSTCTGGTLNEPPAYWAQQAKDMYPGYKGSRPRMMLVHGNRDQVINFNDHREATKQWCTLHNLDPESPTKKYALPSQPNYEVSVYGSSVMAITADGVTHDNPAKVDETCQFWGL
ncbi:Esterase, PHB depolymerase [Kalmanozyma brasiliensis GHG001]|uniref:Carboxylic ester hydrolase n=1 Tax=Kalmanozyma brasiliensis (strain GHG001) TaxID=1365824 RepID=V5EEH4_KALBG|nr:Esterase, PHB depolymerase [Kalmanozyma brasiliensis GHG001]EST08901.1 Esterase, PHB depolymerase [Kalmanozyma brasiliensis GHG001]